MADLVTRSFLLLLLVWVGCLWDGSGMILDGR